MVRHRVAVEWTLLALAAVGYLIVYLAIVHSSAIGFFSGLALCILVAAASIAMQFVPGAIQPPEMSAELRELVSTDAPAIIAGWIRRLMRSTRANPTLTSTKSDSQTRDPNP
jgi:hypothetical protein